MQMDADTFLDNHGEIAPEPAPVSPEPEKKSGLIIVVITMGIMLCLFAAISLVSYSGASFSRANTPEELIGQLQHALNANDSLESFFVDPDAAEAFRILYGHDVEVSFDGTYDFIYDSDEPIHAIGLLHIKDYARDFYTPFDIRKDDGWKFYYISLVYIDYSQYDFLMDYFSLSGSGFGIGGISKDAFGSPVVSISAQWGDVSCDSPVQEIETAGQDGDYYNAGIDCDFSSIYSTEKYVADHNSRFLVRFQLHLENGEVLDGIYYGGIDSTN